MYNCSGRYLTNVYDISKLPLQHCSTCLETNVTCLSWCCELMDTSVNNEIPETIEVEEIVNGTAVNTTALNPELNKVCYCPIDKYGMNCQSFYNAQCILEILSPNMDCYSNDGQKLKGLQYYDKENNCPLYNYTDIINMEYKLNCTQVLSAAYNLSLATNNFTFNNNYLIKQPSYYVSTTRGVSFTTRIWNFNHLGHSIDISMPINYSQITGNETIKVQLDLGKYYLPDEKMRSIYNGGRITVQSGFAYGSSVNGGGIPKSVVTYINIKNYFKNTEFFDKEVKLKTIKQILTIVIPIVVGCILLLILCLFIVYMLYKKSKPMKISC
ncbi:hypothetical protein BCR32DRAFT_28010 [Anaeromyces robustus]|uniref:Uncharacterized protein n=1 Tax=Anaeromyces robustus TaxID=1754192 RepID=A0A1Y1XM84_9FUNG|nr:hypothetical protein BCR32DRAFT_28010 [Anaeromyces robustus]|eukprot:ORX86813.1 hypothetical protein BCR32DRAFT_28010 [Anaeromyces robustus]